MRRQHGDGGTEVFGHLVDFAREEGELPAEGLDPGTDLPALHGLQGVRKFAGGVEELSQPDHRTGVVPLLRGAEQGLGHIASGAGLDDVLEQLLQGTLGCGFRAVEPGSLRTQDSGRSCWRQCLSGRVLVGVAPDDFPARRVRVSGQGDHGRGRVLDQVGEGDAAAVGGEPRLEQVQLAAALRGLRRLRPPLSLGAGQLRAGVVVLVGEVGGEGAVVPMQLL